MTKKSAQKLGRGPMRTARLAAAALAGLLALAPLAQAEDIDIYSGITWDGAKPNLLVLLDNAAAWNGDLNFTCTTPDGWRLPANNDSKIVGFEQCGLYNAIKAIGSSEALAGNINMGLMMFSSGSTAGGTFKFPSSSPYGLVTMDAAGIAAYTNAVKSIDRQADGANNAAVAAIMNEAWAFYTGRTGPSGVNYTSPVTSACQKNFVVYIANATNNGKPQDNLPWNSARALAEAGATTAQQAEIVLPSGLNKYQSNWGDEWARFMYQSDASGTYASQQSIVTYTIILTDGSNPEYVEFLKSVGSRGGKYFIVNLGDMTALVQALLTVMNEVQAVDSVFSSASLPVSVNTQGTYLNQVYMGMFRPDSKGSPRWMGNLKQYKFKYDELNDTVVLSDSEDQDAISKAKSGFIAPSAKSFWTRKTAEAPDSTGGFWVNAPSGDGGGFDYPDGDKVEKGGVAQQLRLASLTTNYATSPASPRRLYTYCPTGTGCVSRLSDTSNVFATTNSALTAGVLGGNAPAVIESLSRSGATVTVRTAGNHTFSVGNTITISGATPGDYNGNFTIASVPDSTRFTYQIVESPPASAGSGFTATKITGIASTVISLTSSTTSGVTTATARTSAPHGLTVGSTVSIAGAAGAEYNGTFTVTGVSGGDTFTYTITRRENPPTSATGGAAKVGSNTYSIASISRVAGSTEVGIYITGSIATGNGNNKSWYITAGNTVTISGTTSNPANAYNKTWTVKGNGGSGCSTAPNGNAAENFFCITVPLSYSPEAIDPNNGITASPVTSTVNIASLVRGASTISGSCPAATAPATVTATTSAAHGLTTGDRVNIACPGQTCTTGFGAGNSVAVLSVPSSTTFTYSIDTTPAPCASGTITASTSSSISRDNLINWVRGHDNFGDEPSPGRDYTVRPSIHGDVLHSRPVVINYGGNPGKVVVFYGANDGVFRAVNGNRTDAIDSVPAGNEMWGLVLPEFYGKLNRLRNNSPLLALPSTPSGLTPTPRPKDYFVDGATGLYQTLRADGTTDKAYIYLSMRRGGRLIYALDVSNPSDPRVLWRKSNTDDGFSELGQTWSQPKVARIKGHANPVLVFGAGYDPAEDSEPPAANTMGRGIFVLDAFTGARLWSATASTVTGMNHAIVADITLLDRDGDAKIDRFYAADLGGNVWRVDLETANGNAPVNWNVIKLAELGCNAGACAAGTTPRKFFYAPDVVPVNSSTGSFDAVLVGSGDREHPLYDTSSGSAYNVVNRFYMLKDTRPGKDGSGQATITHSLLFDATTSGTYDNSGRGYYITLATGEKIVNAPLTLAGYTYFGTNQPKLPDAASCESNLGVARGYRVRPLSGEYGYTVYDGGGLPPTAVGGLVSMRVNGVDKTVPFCTGCAPGEDPPINADCKSAIGACKPENNVSKKRTRTYWYTNK